VGDLLQGAPRGAARRHHPPAPRQRPDWDGILHVNPQGREKGLAFFYNPLTEPITRTIRVPLHYTGLRGQARVSVDGAKPSQVTLDPQSVATLEVRIPARGRTWMVFTGDSR
jgi:hypothetical protein